MVPVTPPRNLTAVLFVQTLIAEDLEPVRGAMQQIYAAFPEFRIAVISSAGIQFAGPFAKARDFRAALAEIQIEESVPDPGAAEQFYQRLPAALHDFGSDWSSVMLIARFPKLEPPLDEFAPAFLAAKIPVQKVRALFWNLSSEPLPILDVLASVTGGAVVKTGMDIFLASLTGSTQSFAEVSWTDPKPPRGFELIAAQVQMPVAAVAVPRFSAADGVEFPDLARYVVYRQQLLKAESGAENEFQSSLDTVLSINPGDAKALRLGADFHIRRGDHRRGAEYLAWLSEVQPGGVLLAELGHEQFLAKDFDSAEKSLLSARKLAVSTPAMSEELVRIHLARSDDAGTLPFLEEVIQSDPKRQDLWLLRADAAARLKDWKLQADSLERALALGGSLLDRRTMLVRLYFEHADSEHAQVHVDVAIPTLPQDAVVHATYADFLDQSLPGPMMHCGCSNT